MITSNHPSDAVGAAPSSARTSDPCCRPSPSTACHGGSRRSHGVVPLYALTRSTPRHTPRGLSGLPSRSDDVVSRLCSFGHRTAVFFPSVPVVLISRAPKSSSCPASHCGVNATRRRSHTKRAVCGAATAARASHALSSDRVVAPVVPRARSIVYGPTVHETLFTHRTK